MAKRLGQGTGFLYANQKGEMVLNYNLPRDIEASQSLFLDEEEFVDFKSKSKIELYVIYISRVEKRDQKAVENFLKLVPESQEIVDIYHELEATTDFWAAGAEYWKSMLEDIIKAIDEMGEAGELIFGTFIFWINRIYETVKRGYKDESDKIETEDYVFIPTIEKMRKELKFLKLIS